MRKRRARVRIRGSDLMTDAMRDKAALKWKEMPKRCRNPVEEGNGREVEYFLEPPQRNAIWLTLIFKFLTSTNVRKSISTVLSQLVYGHLL